MTELLHQTKLNDTGTQRVELYEDGMLWIIDDKQHNEIKLEAWAAMNLLGFLAQDAQYNIIEQATLDDTWEAFRLGVRRNVMKKYGGTNDHE